jgi:hypothetical protein
MKRYAVIIQGICQDLVRSSSYENAIKSVLTNTRYSLVSLSDADTDYNCIVTSESGSTKRYNVVIR